MCSLGACRCKMISSSTVPTDLDLAKCRAPSFSVSPIAAGAPRDLPLRSNRRPIFLRLVVVRRHVSSLGFNFTRSAAASIGRISIACVCIASAVRHSFMHDDRDRFSLVNSLWLTTSILIPHTRRSMMI